MSELDRLLAELRRLDARLGVRDTDFTVNRRGGKPVPEDHSIDAHEHAAGLSRKRGGAKRLHERRQRLVVAIDRERLAARVAALADQRQTADVKRKLGEAKRALKKLK